MTQAQLADLVGIHRVTLTKIETGNARVSRELLERLAAALSRSNAWLLGQPEQIDELELARAKMTNALSEFSDAVDLLQHRISAAATDETAETLA